MFCHPSTICPQTRRPGLRPGQGPAELLERFAHGEDPRPDARQCHRRLRGLIERGWAVKASERPSAKETGREKGVSVEHRVKNKTPGSVGKHMFVICILKITPLAQTPGTPRNPEVPRRCLVYLSSNGIRLGWLVDQSDKATVAFSWTGL